MSKSKKEKVNEAYDLVKNRPIAGVIYLTGNGFFRLVFNHGALIIILSLITSSICIQAKKISAPQEKEILQEKTKNISGENNGH